MYGLIFMVCLLASLAGAVCGIGGGVIIKPLLDALGILNVAQINFLSGCTVLSMAAYSVMKSKMSGKSRIRTNTSQPLAIGAAAGGIAGKQMFGWVTAISGNENLTGAVQAAVLLIVTFGTLIYMVYQDKIQTMEIESRGICGLTGFALGIISSFLGIGGGPINLVMLYYFFSMETKEAAENSLYIIFFSQSASLIMSVLTGSVPEISFGLLALMIAGGIGGGICGRRWNKRLQKKTVEKLLSGLMLLMIFINIFNLYKFLCVDG